MDIIKINNLNFKYENKEIFKNLNLSIEECLWYTIIGNNGSGKSTLVKILSGLIKSRDIYIDGLEVNSQNLFDIRKKMSVVFENPNTNLICQTVREELSFPLENIGFNNVEKQVKKISKLFSIEELLDNKISDLSNSEKQIIAIAAALIIEPKVLILDEAFTYLTSEKTNIFNILKKEKITIINITHDVEETLFGDNIIIIKDGEILINEKKELVYEKESLFKSAHQQVPFIVDLSNKLKYYGLIDKIYYDMKEMIGDLWK